MTDLTRRDFIQKTSLIGFCTLLPMDNFFKETAGERLFKMSVNPGAIGVDISTGRLLSTVRKYGFEAVSPPLRSLLEMEKPLLTAFIEEQQKSGISWDAANLPVEFRKDKQTFKEGIDYLRVNGKMMKELGVKACSTWIMPTNDELTYLENFNQHAERLGEVADILSEYDIRLGLEYVGPKTLMVMKKHPFISSLAEVRELIAATKMENVGVQLDSFHWYCAEETVEDLLSLKPEEIITCDLNDAVKGRDVDTQLDNERELPGASGVIDLKSFLEALVTIKYDGCVRAEPFNARLNAMSNDTALALTAKKMQQTLNLIK